MKDFIKRYKKNLIILVFIIAAISFVNLSTSYEMSDDSYILNIKKEFLNINNLSSLTYSPHDGYLYATVNKPAKLLIISTGGAMRQIKNMPFIKDAESIEHLTENMFLAADEETSILYQAEGVVIAPNGDIYIESEPNIFYHFKKQVDDKNNDNQQS